MTTGFVLGTVPALLQGTAADELTTSELVGRQLSILINLRPPTYTIVPQREHELEPATPEQLPSAPGCRSFRSPVDRSKAETLQLWSVGSLRSSPPISAPPTSTSSMRSAAPFQVYVQADLKRIGSGQPTIEPLLYVRSQGGQMVPIRALAEVQRGDRAVARYGL